MRAMLVRTVGLMLVAAAAAAGCAWTGGPARAAEPGGVTFGERFAGVRAPRAGARLSLIALDRTRPTVSRVLVAGIDGFGPRAVVELRGAARALDLRFGLLAVAVDGRLAVVDLASGRTRVFDGVAAPASARLIDPDTLVTTAGGDGCAAPVRVLRADLNSGEVTDLRSFHAPVEVAGADAERERVLLFGRTCDGIITLLRSVAVEDGVEGAATALDGCRQAALAQDGLTVMLFRQGCPPDADTAPPPIATLNDLRDGARRDVFAGEDVRMRWPFVFRPDSRAVAVGGDRLGEGTIWLFDRDRDERVPAAWPVGPEATPVAWGASGRLLVHTTRAQGVCAYTILDPSTGATEPVSEEVSYCGANGDVLGWATPVVR